MAALVKKIFNSETIGIQKFTHGELPAFCAICQENESDKNKLMQSLCDKTRHVFHTFHKNCLISVATQKQWDNKTYFECPLCRKHLQPLDLLTPKEKLYNILSVTKRTMLSAIIATIALTASNVAIFALITKPEDIVMIHNEMEYPLTRLEGLAYLAKHCISLGAPITSTLGAITGIIAGNIKNDAIKSYTNTTGITLAVLVGTFATLFRMPRF